MIFVMSVNEKENEKKINFLCTSAIQSFSTGKGNIFILQDHAKHLECL